MDVYLGKLRDLFDLAVYLERNAGEVDWDAFESFGFYAVRPLWTGLRCASDLFRSPACRDIADRLEGAARITRRYRAQVGWLVRTNLVEGRLHRRLPLSVLSALSFALHCPEHLFRFAGEFLRVFLFPDESVIRAQYRALPGGIPLPLLYVLRCLHVPAVICHRIGARWLTR
jgi:hypothetical protein